jgi:ribosomal protein L11 methyltransferase
MKSEFDKAKVQWVEVTLKTPSRLSEAISSFLIDLGSNGVVLDEVSHPGKVAPSEEEHVAVRAYFHRGPDWEETQKSIKTYLHSLAGVDPSAKEIEMNTATLSPDDWSENWKRFFSVTHVTDRLTVKPAWIEYRPRGGEIVIVIDVGMAFGTGSHPTTKMCLKALEDILSADHPGAGGILSMLDVGTGSGILGIAAAKMGVPKVRGIDIDPIALRYAQKNIELNEVQDRVTVSGTPLSKERGTFSLVVANILSETLLELREDLVGHLEDGGLMILSGIWKEKKRPITRNFSKGPLELKKTLDDSGWICLIYKRKY